jgi:hypothetical protein
MEQVSETFDQMLPMPCAGTVIGASRTLRPPVQHHGIGATGGTWAASETTQIELADVGSAHVAQRPGVQLATISGSMHKLTTRPSLAQSYSIVPPSCPSTVRLISLLP